ncbi:calcium-binding protein [Lutimaribacter marinistellae]|uniref:Calcium-binding protein n=1 Tax=Lutimaribacter marinistellae TaxID=1820329 RepID=A0ABV7TGI1_9RHOB
MNFSTISDNTLLPFGNTQIPVGDDNIQGFSIAEIFEDGFRFGTGTFNGFWVGTNGGVAFARDSGYSYYNSPSIFPWNGDLDTQGSPLDSTGVFFDLNAERDSVVVTWQDVGYYSRNFANPATFQLELIDIGGGNAEIVFRYEDTESSGSIRDAGMILPGGESLYFGGNEVIDVPFSELDETPGNTGVVGVWQFQIIDGSIAVNSPIEGTDAPDLLTGNGFADTISGGAGNDTIDGDSGNDRLTGGNGDDFIDGGSGSDSLAGGAGDDSIQGGSGVDTIKGGDGNDTIDGGELPDSIEGGEGDDLIVDIVGGFYSSVGDTINGNDGNDTIFGGSGEDVLGGQSGDDMIRGGDGHDWIGGGSGNDVLSGGLGNDRFWGGTGDDFIYGDAGRNEATGGAGADTFLLTPTGTLTIRDFNATEGDRVIVNADDWDRGDFYLQRVVGADGESDDDRAVILHRFDHETSYRTVAEIYIGDGADMLQLNFPHDAGEAIAPILWDLS